MHVLTRFAVGLLLVLLPITALAASLTLLGAGGHGGGASGSLSGVYTNLGAGPTAINLTTLTSGGTDYNTVDGAAAAMTLQCDKSGGGGVVSAFAVSGSGGTNGLDPQAWTYSFTDGQANPGGTGCVAGPSQSNLQQGWYFGGAAAYGWTFTVPAGTATQTVTVYAGSDTDTLNITATLSDGSAAPYTNSSCTAASWVGCRYVITYNAASNSQTLTVKGVTSGAGYIGFSAATLVPGGNEPFAALHTYFMSPTGSDSNNGTSQSTPWLTPNHSVVCGDVIIAAAGSYTSQFGTNEWGAVSGCPSTTGGIDGTGGVYFATVLCAGPVLTSCSINGGTAEVARVDASHWAMEGFKGTQNTNGNSGCFTMTSETSATLSYIAFINNLASTCDQAGFDSYSFTTPGGVDEQAVVGAIAYNSAVSSFSLCGSGISLIPNAANGASGTHVFVAGAFSYKNINTPGCSTSGHTTDGEGIIFDSWSCGSYQYPGVVEQSVLWANGGPGVEVFPNVPCGGSGTDVASYIIKSTTAYGNYQDTTHTGNAGELALQDLSPTGAYTVTGNVFEATTATTNSGALSMVGLEVWCVTLCTSEVSVTGNYGWQSNPGTVNIVGTPNTDVYNNNIHNTTSFPFGTNTYSTPGFASPGSLPSTAPNCSSYADTTDCMIGAGVYADLTPSGGAASDGYKPPGACAPDSAYPTYLKGIVYLQWNAGTATITENPGLVTKPCNM